MSNYSMLLLLLSTLLVSSTQAWISPVPSLTQHQQHSKPTTTCLKDLAVTLDGETIRGDITPLGDLVLVKVKDTLQASSGGVLLPDQSQERPTEGLVMEAGPGRIHPDTGIRIPNPVSKGVSVLYGKFDGKAIEYKGEECQMIRDEDVMLYYTGVTMSLDNVHPCRDYVLVELPEKKEQLTSSGVVIADMVTKDDLPCEGVVINVGEGRMNSSGKFSPSPVKVGDFIKFKDYAGNEVRIEGKDYMLVQMIQILSTATNSATQNE